MALFATFLLLVYAIIYCSRRFTVRFDANLWILGVMLALISAGSLCLIPAGGAAQAVPGGRAATTGTAGPLYQRFCLRCHGTDGKGERGAGVPDFTKPTWQRRHNDAQVAAAILEGKGSAMPAFAGRLNKDQAKLLVAHIRAFAPQPSSGKGSAATPASTNSTATADQEFLRLQQEFDELNKQLRELKAAQDDSKKPGAAAKKKASEPVLATAPRAPGQLFRQLCQRCHGPGGEGDRAKGGDDVPDFRLPHWHQKRTDAQMLSSILKGTEGTMPAFRRQISEVEARGLVAHVRGFVPTSGQQ
jgi:mono/diheme cytochrome c family protein